MVQTADLHFKHRLVPRGSPRCPDNHDLSKCHHLYSSIMATHGCKMEWSVEQSQLLLQKNIREIPLGPPPGWSRFGSTFFLSVTNANQIYTPNLYFISILTTLSRQKTFYITEALLRKDVPQYIIGFLHQYIECMQSINLYEQTSCSINSILWQGLIPLILHVLLHSQKKNASKTLKGNPLSIILTIPEF